MKFQKALSFAIGMVLMAPIPDAWAEGRAEGGIVIRDEATVYLSSAGNGTGDVYLPRGSAVSGVTTQLGMVSAYQFEEMNGRLHIAYLRLDGSGQHRSIPHYGWMDSNDLSQFTYECGCARTRYDIKCYPFAELGFFTLAFQYNACFKEGMTKKLAELRSIWQQENTPPKSVTYPETSTSAEKPLTNDDVVALIKVGLGEDLVVSKIQQAPHETLDVTTDALIKLKTEGISNTILNAMIKRAGQRK
jgi:hypothetical protein